jgi:hypothetical protein
LALVPFLLPSALAGLLVHEPASPPPPVEVLPALPAPGRFPTPPLPALPLAPEPPAMAAPPVAPRSAALIGLERAIRARLFQGPLAPAQPDPDGTEWQQARAQGHRPGCDEVGPLRYLNRAVDLDNDGRDEQVVAVLGSYACGSRGCTLLVFRQGGVAGSAGLEPLAELDLFQAPLLLSPRRQAGWRELVMPAPMDQGQPVRLVWQAQQARYGPAAGPAQPSEAGSGLTPLLEMEALPFEQLGRPLTCEP